MQAGTFTRMAQHWFQLLPLLVLSLPPMAAAQSPGAGSAGGASGSQGISADEANNPAALLPQIQFQDWYSPTLDGTGSRDRYENVIYTKLLFPIKPTGFLPAELFRLQIPAFTATANGHTALGDINGFDLLFAINNKTWQVGFGPAFSLPTDTYHLAGDDKWELGPGGVVVYHGIPTVTLVALAYDTISFAGNRNRPDTNVFTFEPFIIKTFPKGFFLRFDPIWTFDMKHDAAATIPLNLGFGRTIPIGHDVLNAYLQPEWNVARPDDNRVVPRFTLRFHVAILFGPGPKK